MVIALVGWIAFDRPAPAPLPATTPSIELVPLPVSTPTPGVAIPDVAGLPPREATARIEQRGLQARVDAPPGSDAGLIAAGRVTATRPAAGAVVPAGSDVLLLVECSPSCGVPTVPSSRAETCLYPDAAEAPIVEPTSATAGQPIRVHGPAFAGEPTVRVRVDGALVAEARAVAAPDCTYDLAFAAPAAPGPHSLTIELDPPARIEPPFDITVTAS